MKNTRISVGRKLFDGKSPGYVLSKLEEAFSLGCTNEEAYIYAGISKSAFYTYQQKNPAFLDRKRILRARLTLLARMTIVRAMQFDVEVAKWYLANKLPKEFGRDRGRAKKNKL